MASTTRHGTPLPSHCGGTYLSTRIFTCFQTARDFTYTVVNDKPDSGQGVLLGSTIIAEAVAIILQ